MNSVHFFIHDWIKVEYNWSKNARGNDETLATAIDRDFVRKFADEFMRLHVENHWPLQSVPLTEGI